MKFDLRMIDNHCAEVADEMLKAYGHTCGNSGTVIQWDRKCTDKLAVEYQDGRLLISGSEEVHLYRGLVLFLSEFEKNNVKCTVYKKEETINFRETGLMLDCSRNGSASLDFLKKMIRFCAYCGLNQLYLYMEDVYEIPDNPYFGAYRGRFSHSNLKKIDEYGRHMGVEVIPAIQTLAHLHTYLRWPETQKLRDTEDILMAGSKETEEFVRSMIRNASLPFSTKKIHVGMDEADMLGLGNYLRVNGYEERYGIMIRHLDMVCRICQEYCLEPMIWSDMFFRLKSPTGDYYDLPADTAFDEQLRLPENLTLVYWDYYHHDISQYEKNIHLHQKLTDQIRFAGGGWTWNGISPNYSKAEKTISEGIRACINQGIEKAFCTFWFDNGTETPMGTAFYPAFYFAQQCYSSSMEDADEMFFMLTGLKTSEYKLLDKFDHTPGTMQENSNADNPSKYLLYQDVLLGVFDAQIEGLGLTDYYRNLAEELRVILNNIPDKDQKNIFSYYYTLAELLSLKAELGLEVRRAYLSGDKERMRQLCKRINACAQTARSLKDQREQIWFRECRPFGFEVIDIRLGAVAVRLETAHRRLESWLSGISEQLEELEEPRILYAEDKDHPEHRQCEGGFWQNIVSAGNIAGI